jgi:hypothetical protein
VAFLHFRLKQDSVRRATVKRERMGFMFDHDDLRKEIAQEAQKPAA